MAERSEETLGHYLRRERESRRIALDELSRATRISLPFLRALEENNFDFFSQHDFIPGFLNLYARHLGLDSQEVLRRYAIQAELNRLNKTFQQLPLFPDFQSPFGERAERKRLPRQRLGRAIISVFILFGALCLFLYFYLLPKGTNAPEIPRPVLSPNGTQENPWEKAAATHSTDLEDQEDLPPETQEGLENSSSPIRPEINASIKDNKVRGEREHIGKAVLPTKKRVKVIGNRDSKRYHLPGMKYYKKVKAYHRVEFDSEEEAIRAGYHKARE